MRWIALSTFWKTGASGQWARELWLPWQMNQNNIFARCEQYMYITSIRWYICLETRLFDSGETRLIEQQWTRVVTVTSVGSPASVVTLTRVVTLTIVGSPASVVTLTRVVTLTSVGSPASVVTLTRVVTLTSVVKTWNGVHGNPKTEMAEFLTKTENGTNAGITKHHCPVVGYFFFCEEYLQTTHLFIS